MSEVERRQSLRWLLQNQDASGGFRGRTNKDADACYCFWCGGAIQVFDSVSLSKEWVSPTIPFPNEQILGAGELVDNIALASFLGKCQFRFGGIAKAPGEHAGLDLDHYAMEARPEEIFSRSIPHIPLSRGDCHVSAFRICGREFMGGRAIGYLNQRKVFDRAMGEGLYTVEIYMKKICTRFFWRCT